MKKKIYECFKNTPIESSFQYVFNEILHQIIYNGFGWTNMPILAMPCKKVNERN
jgi:hypothetical protein